MFEKASKDLQNFKTGVEKLVSLEPAKITQDLVDEAKQISEDLGQGKGAAGVDFQLANSQCL